MARPADIKPLPASSRVIRWEFNGHARGFYAQRRGQTIQCRIQGFNLKPRDWISQGVALLPWEIWQRTMYWGHPWRIAQPVKTKFVWQAVAQAIEAGQL